MKKDGGVISNWQLHTLSLPMDKVRKKFPHIKIDKPLILSGTVVHDPVGRWKPGFHMRSSLIIELRENIVETANTIYKLQGPGNSDVFPDLGNDILKIFY